MQMNLNKIAEGALNCVPSAIVHTVSKICCFSCDILQSEKQFLTSFTKGWVVSWVGADAVGPVQCMRRRHTKRRRRAKQNTSRKSKSSLAGHVIRVATCHVKHYRTTWLQAPTIFINDTACTSLSARPASKLYADRNYTRSIQSAPIHSRFVTWVLITFAFVICYLIKR